MLSVSNILILSFILIPHIIFPQNANVNKPINSKQYLNDNKSTLSSLNLKNDLVNSQSTSNFSYSNNSFGEIHYGSFIQQRSLLLDEGSPSSNNSSLKSLGAAAFVIGGIIYLADKNHDPRWAILCGVGLACFLIF